MPKLPRTAVILVNLGTPVSPGYGDVWRYLREFLSDSRVVDYSRWLWWPILYGLVLVIRPWRSGKAYARIWDKKHKASPLLVITRAQAAQLQKRLGPRIRVDYAMRYGQPAIGKVLNEAREAGCERVLVAPLYPQYAAATTATVGDEVARWLLAQRFQPAVRMMAPYYDAPAYIAALAAQIKSFLGQLKWKPQMLLASFHGLPERYVQRGDPYRKHCEATVRALRRKLPELEIRLSYQSRFGAEPWLEPATAHMLQDLPGQKIKRVAVVCPGFAADCVETLEEIGIGGRATFLRAGGTKFALVPCLNDSRTGMEMLEALVRQELSGWN
jgi:ferrochelatase